jgi:hypothetical protein
MADGTTNPFTQHYLEISALEPAIDTVKELPAPVKEPGLTIMLPLMIFFTFFIGGFAVVFFKRMRELRNVFTVFIFALVLGAMPIALQTLNQRTETNIKADPDLTPKEVIVASVTSTGFAISWQTSKATNGAINISQSADMKTKSNIYNDGNPKTYHRLVVLNLQPGATYYLQVLSDAKWYQHQGKPITVTLPEK